MIEGIKSRLYQILELDLDVYNVTPYELKEAEKHIKIELKEIIQGLKVYPFQFAHESTPDPPQVDPPEILQLVDKKELIERINEFVK